MRILVLGANGYVGQLVAAAALMDPENEVILAARDPARFAELEHAVIDLLDGTHCPTRDCARSEEFPVRITCTLFDDTLFQLPEVASCDAVVNCIGSVDYFNEEVLTAVNVDLTRAIVEGSKSAGIGQHIYVSTAFAPAVNDADIEERIYDTDDGDDPTVYTRTKREAERIVAASGLDYTILRPSVIIGDSRSGRYDGKRYGLYQLWEGAKRLLPAEIDVMRLACPDARMNFIHQDAFMAATRHILKSSIDQRVVNMVSRHEDAPTLETLWSLLFDATSWPKSLEWVPSNDALEYRGLHPRIRAFNGFCRTNVEIASRNWKFERTAIDQMIRDGVRFPEASLATITVCQNSFLDRYERTNGKAFHD